MEKNKLLESLERLQANNLVKQKRDAICKTMLESTNASVLVEAVSMGHELGFPMVVFDLGKLANVGAKEQKEFRMALGLTQEQFENVVLGSKKELWSIAKPKEVLYVNKSDFQSEDKDALRILIKKSVPPSGHLTTEMLFDKAMFKPANLIRNAYVTVKDKKVVLDKDIYIATENNKLTQLAVTKVSNDKYIVAIKIEGDPEIYAFPMDAVSFKAAFTPAKDLSSLGGEEKPKETPAEEKSNTEEKGGEDAGDAGSEDAGGDAGGGNDEIPPGRNGREIAKKDPVAYAIYKEVAGGNKYKRNKLEELLNKLAGSESLDEKIINVKIKKLYDHYGPVKKKGKTETKGGLPPGKNGRAILNVDSNAFEIYKNVVNNNKQRQNKLEDFLDDRAGEDVDKMIEILQSSFKEHIKPVTENAEEVQGGIPAARNGVAIFKTDKGAYALYNKYVNNDVERQRDLEARLNGEIGESFEGNVLQEKINAIKQWAKEENW